MKDNRLETNVELGGEKGNAGNIWERVLKGLPKFGEKLITREQKDDIYNGTDLYGADKIDFVADKEKLDDLLTQMDEWGDASIFYGQVIGGDGKLSADELVEKRKEITHEMAGYVAEAYGIHKQPQLEITRELGLVDGGYQNDGNRVLLSESMLRNMRSPKEIMRFLAHELMHCYDETEIVGNGSQLGAELEYNQKHYFKDAEHNQEAYRGQLMERRAFAREEAVMKQLDEYTMASSA